MLLRPSRYDKTINEQHQHLLTHSVAQLIEDFRFHHGMIIYYFIIRFRAADERRAVERERIGMSTGNLNNN